MASTTLTNESYTVGLICALEDELAACQGMLDEEHPDLSQVENDSNAYSLGSIGQHNVVIACLPSGTMGTNAAATTASNMLRSFPKIRFGLMVGIGGGAPDPESSDPMKDIRLGDIVVSTPDDTHGKQMVALILTPAYPSSRWCRPVRLWENRRRRSIYPQRLFEQATNCYWHCCHKAACSTSEIRQQGPSIHCRNAQSKPGYARRLPTPGC